ncbi:hypothetical protein EHV15_04660 [Paenibacillus oralis]|uniref:Uncharacterized protein n=1 Tax=Paenibacillus oralis TaxID=2490856 RepID=A0A3P3TVZ7_9BACL|nr:hypothetical protein [Paenibacillus oralis]RRJ62317.1 hypothetical protein EHV15_04660 [Paenibacillus oralis]
MRIKTIVSALLVAATISLPYTPTYAQDAGSDNEIVTPFVHGLGDTREDAIDVLPNQMLNLFVQGPDDEDWFKWTNDTGSPKYISSWVYSRNNYNNVNVGVIVKYANGKETNLLLAEPSELGNIGNPSMFDNLIVPEDATVYLRVKAVTFTEIGPYEFNFWAV